MQSRKTLLVSNLASCFAYKAAYVEHATVSPCGSGSCGLDQTTSSVEAYDAYAADASGRGAQIIVFPEYGITGFSSYPKSSWVSGGYTATIPDLTGQVPCDKAGSFADAPAVVSLSCTARKYNIVVVANLMEYIGGMIYNTNVALDSDGTYLAKYHKRNLWGESNLDTPPLEQVSFKTKFGETFGMFVCADLIYEHPALDLVNSGIKNFVMPLAWSNEMAHMQALAYAQGWSLANNVNLILANYRTTSESGSGVLVSGYPVSQYYSLGSDAGPVQVGEVSASPSMSRAKPFARFDLEKLGVAANWNYGSLGSQVCSGSVCCTASATSGDSTGYVLAALDGTDTNSGMQWPAQICAVLPCTNTKRCLTFQAPTGSLTGVAVTMTGGNSVSIVPEVLGYTNGGEVLLTPGEELQFQRTGTGMANANVSSSVTLLSAIIYGRPANVATQAEATIIV